MGELDFLQILQTFGAGAAGVYAFLFLLRRGDSQQQNNIAELRRQRDEQTARAERAEHERDLIEERYARFVTEQQEKRHKLRSEVAAYQMQAELYRRRLEDRGEKP